MVQPSFLHYSLNVRRYSTYQLNGEILIKAEMESSSAYTDIFPAIFRLMDIIFTLPVALPPKPPPPRIF